MDRITQMGCLVCRLFLQINDSPCAPHHIEGKTNPGSHLKTIALCGRHHQEPDNQNPKRWVSRHGDGKSAFESEYLSESELLECQQAIVNKALEVGYL